MTKEEAILQKQQLESFLKQYIRDKSLQELSNQIVDDYVMIISDEMMHGIIFLGSRPASFKWGNICLDLRRAAITTAEWAVAAVPPDSVGNAFRLIIITAIWIARITEEDVNDTESSLLEWMHKANIYEHPIEEKELLKSFYDYCLLNNRPIERWEIDAALKRLDAINCIDINSGKITLCEKVWGKR